MKSRMKEAVLAVAMLAATAGKSHADQIFDFSSSYVAGNVSGTMTGQVVLPFNGDGTGAATEVVIDSFPSIFVPYLGPAPVTIGPTFAPTWDNPGNTFTVASGNIVSSSTFTVWFSPAAYVGDMRFELNGLYDTELNDGGTLPGNWPGVDYYYGTLNYQSTPEPATLTLLASGILAIGGFGLYRRRRKTSGSSTAC